MSDNDNERPSERAMRIGMAVQASGAIVLTDGARLYIHGRTYRLVAIAVSPNADDKANAYMAAVKGTAVLYVDGYGTVYIGNKSDPGVKG
jgi:hypothetical protein